MPANFPILEIFRAAIRALTRNWGRAALTSLSMVMGTASLVLVVVAGVSGRKYTLDQIHGIGSNLIYVYYEASDSASGYTALSDKLNLDDVKAIEGISQGVRKVAPVVLDYDTLIIRGLPRVVTLIGTMPDYQTVRSILVLQGRFIDAEDDRSRSKVCLVTEQLSHKLTLDPAYRGRLTIHGIEFAVIGVFRERVSTFGESEVSDHSVILPVSVIRYFKQRDTVDAIYVSAENLDWVPTLTAEIRQLLTLRHRNQSAYKVDNLTEILKAANKISLGLTLVLFVIAGISLLVSGIGIMNVMLITVTERTREIGIKMAAGARRKVLLIEFLLEALLLSGGGGIVGILLGVAVPHLVRFFAPSIVIEIPTLAIVLGFGVTLAVGLTFGLMPAMRASRLNPVEALRYE
ncbi:MAG: ABC transporter permease [Terriglobia bacterium]